MPRTLIHDVVNGRRRVETTILLRSVFIAALLSLASVWAAAQQGLHEYRPARKVMGPIRSIGGTLGGQYKIWEEAFQKYHPGIRFVDTLISSEASIGGLY